MINGVQPVGIGQTSRFTGLFAQKIGDFIQLNGSGVGYGFTKKTALLVNHAFARATFSPFFFVIFVVSRGFEQLSPCFAG